MKLTKPNSDCVDIRYNPLANEDCSSDSTSSSSSTQVDWNNIINKPSCFPACLSPLEDLFVPLTRNLTINSITYDLTVDRTWSLTTTNIPEGTNLYYTNARARAAISLTTTGTSGAATYDSLTGILNIPNYTFPSYTFQNGITESAGTVSLGGSLVQNTLLTAGSFSINLRGTALPNNWFYNNSAYPNGVYHVGSLNGQLTHSIENVDIFGLASSTFLGVVTANATVSLQSFGPSYSQPPTSLGYNADYSVIEFTGTGSSIITPSNTALKFWYDVSSSSGSSLTIYNNKFGIGTFTTPSTDLRSELHLKGSLSLENISSSLNADYALLAANLIHFATATTATRTITVPTVVTSNIGVGKTFIIRNSSTSSFNLTIQLSGGDVFDVGGGASSITLNPNSSVTITAIGSTVWSVISNGSSGYAFNNGLTNTLGVIQLGGNLTQNTTITNNTFSLTYAHSSSRTSVITSSGGYQWFNGGANTTMEYNPVGYNSLPSLRLNPSGASFTQSSYLHIRGNSNGNDSLLLAQNSAATTMFNITENGIITTGFRIDFNIALGSTNLIQAARALQFDLQQTPNQPSIYNFKQTGGTYSTVGSTFSYILTNGVYSVSSGSDRAAILHLNNTMTQTGTAAGIMTGLYVNVAATVLGSWRAIETVTGDLIFGSTSGNVGINTTTVTNGRLNIAGSISTRSAINFASGTQKSTGLTSGDLDFNGDYLSFTNSTNVRGRISVIRINNTSAGTLSIDFLYSDYIFTGTTTTWTLTTVAAGLNVRGHFVNKGSGNITVNTNAGGNDIWIAGAVSNSVVITPGDAFWITGDGTHFIFEQV